MEPADRISKGLSFDDVLLRPDRSSVLPRDVKLQTRLTRGLTLNIPLVSAAMDTVTESRLAIALAQEGGLGIVHKNLSIDDQANEVDRVKRSQAGIITDPFTLSPDHLLQDAENLMARYHVSGVPITGKNGDLLGILTNRDMRFEEDLSKTIGSVMTPKERLVTVIGVPDYAEAKRILHRHRIEKLPIVDAQGKLQGLLTIKDIQKARNFPSSCTDDMGRLRVGAAIGVGEGELPRAEALLNASVDVLVIDSAHGHSNMVIDTVRLVKQHFPKARSSRATLSPRRPRKISSKPALTP
jgi:IMP dehydrogenase